MLSVLLCPNKLESEASDPDRESSWSFFFLNNQLFIAGRSLCDQVSWAAGGTQLWRKAYKSLQQAGRQVNQHFHMIQWDYYLEVVVCGPGTRYRVWIPNSFQQRKIRYRYLTKVAKFELHLFFLSFSLKYTCIMYGTYATKVFDYFNRLNVWILLFLLEKYEPGTGWGLAFIQTDHFVSGLSNPWQVKDPTAFGAPDRDR